MIAVQDIRMGDTVRLSNGATFVVDSISEWYQDSTGRHDGPFVMPRPTPSTGFIRHLLSEIVEIVERNGRLCAICGGGVTSTNPKVDFCRMCHYTGAAQEREHAAVIDVFREAFPTANVAIEHTGGGCFWLAISPENTPYYWAATDGNAGIPDFEEGELWAVVLRYCDDEDVARELKIGEHTYHEIEGVPVIESERPVLSHREVIAFVSQDMKEVLG